MITLLRNPGGGRGDWSMIKRGGSMDGASWFSKPGKNSIFFATRGAGAHQNFKFDFQSFSCLSVILNMSLCPIAHNHCPQYAMIKVYDPYFFKLHKNQLH